MIPETKKLINFAVAVSLFLLGACSPAAKNQTNSDGDASLIVGSYIYQDYPLDKPIELDGLNLLNYAFGRVNDTYDGITIGNPACFERVVALKRENPNLKITLSLGGANAGGFSKMAADSLKRLSFANDCARIIRQYGIDGIDVDWEFPCNSSGSPDDYDNYVKMMRDIRNAIGDKAILSLAGGGDLPGINVKAVLPYIDYVNAMTYDLGWAPYHHTSLYRSNLTGWRSVEEVVEFYNQQGFPNDKIVLGLAFYGRGDEINFPGWVGYGEMKLSDGQQEMWDDVAKVPYIANSNGVMLLGYENPESIKIKCDYIKKMGFLGGFAWRYGNDNAAGDLRHAMCESLLDNTAN